MADLKEQWQLRQRQLGNTNRAVLFKNFPAFFNDSLHAAHVRFLLDCMPADTASMLDVGCGYGRTALAIKQQRPALQIRGVELCEEFAIAFAQQVGPCFSGSVTDFETVERFDVITIVTLLMYLDRSQQQATLQKLWRQLQPGGSLLLIEPCDNVLIALRRRLHLRALAPTGGEVGYFEPKAFATWCCSLLPQAVLQRQVRFGMPFVGFPSLHFGLALQKRLA